MIDINQLLQESTNKLTNDIYKLDINKLNISYKNYEDVINLPYYSVINKINNYQVGCIIPFSGRQNMVRLNVELLNKQTVKPAIILTCSNIPDYNFAKDLEELYDNVFTHVTLNYPLGKKFYDSTKFAQTLGGLNYLMILGSDDILSLNYVENCLKKLNNGYDLVGSRKWLMCTNNNELYKLEYKSVVDILLGAGKIYTKKFLDMVNWDIFDQYRPLHLDENGEYLFNNTNLKKIVLNGDEFIMCIKGDWDCINPKENILKSQSRLNTQNISNELPIIIGGLGIDVDKKIFNLDKPKICILTTLYFRHNLNEIVLNYYGTLKENLKNICDIELIACGSNDTTNMDLAIKNGFNYINYSNNPLTQKHNALYLEAKKYNPDFTILIGSDDLICENVIYKYLDFYKLGVDYGGILDFKCIDSSGYWYWGGYTDYRIGEPVGGGRYFSKRLLNNLNWLPWGNIKADSALDGISNNNIIKLNIPILKKTISCANDNINLVTIRSNVNITDMSKINNKVSIPNPLNNLVIDKNGPIKNIQLPYNSNILSDLNPKLNYHIYEPNKDITLSDIFRAPNSNNNIINLKNNSKKKSVTSSGNVIEPIIESKPIPQDKPEIKSQISSKPQKLFNPDIESKPKPEVKKEQPKPIKPAIEVTPIVKTIEPEQPIVKPEPSIVKPNTPQIKSPIKSQPRDNTAKNSISRIPNDLDIGRLRKQRLNFGRR
jgi:hypothetical protein